ncbi:unnamed protein product [Prorocentrum cordatum]|uniref:HIT domain-containing protein n=1 Tax=Prorocentrum cordatum TaxID=2364126 RepID=A0ABN9U1A7_9DINO|nr:unnamed protein product [Polarella glacialis]
MTNTVGGFETDHAIAILDAFPCTPGHALLLPKAKGYVTVMDMPAEAAAAVLRELPRLARLVQGATGADGVNVVQNNYAAAGQVVPHPHWHVIPRLDGDKLVQLGKSAGPISAEDAAAMLAKMKDQ